MKTCIACAEEIQTAAKLCKHCGTEQTDPRFTPGESALQSVIEALPEFTQDTYGNHDSGPEGKNESLGKGVKKVPGKPIVLPTAIISGLALIVATLSILPNLNQMPVEQEQQAQETASNPIEELLPPAPSSLMEALGLGEKVLAEDLSWAECARLEEKIITPPFEADSIVVIEQLKDVENDKTYPEALKASQEFVVSNPWVLEIARLDAGAPRVSEHSDPIFENFLKTSSFEGAGQLIINYPNLHDRYRTEFQKQLVDVCGLTQTVSLQERVVQLARKVVDRASEESPYASVGWWPEDYFSYYLDDSVAWKWVDRRCSGSGVCWHVDVISRDGCNSLYAEISVSDSSGKLVDWSNDSARGLLAGQVAELEFRSFESGKLTGRVIEINCRP